MPPRPHSLSDVVDMFILYAIRFLVFIVFNVFILLLETAGNDSFSMNKSNKHQTYNNY